MIAIIDYGMGNLRSVLKKFENLKIEAQITGDLKEIEKADKLILPGVGHFANGVKNLKEKGIWEVLNEKVLVKQTPILGICLGMQLMAGFSEEGNCEGLNWFDSKVVKFRINNTLQYKVPHMGWNQLTVERECLLSKMISESDTFYFVHSFHIICNNKEDIIFSTDYEYKFTSAINKGNIWGVQFHPEKSHIAGEQMLNNFYLL
jgi:glutamine amidotransferase